MCRSYYSANIGSGCVFTVCLSVCLSAGKLKKLLTSFEEIVGLVGLTDYGTS